MIQRNLDSIVIESNDSVLEEMSEKYFRLYMIKMVHEAKDEIKEQMQAMNDNTNKLKEHLQEAKDHFNKEIEIHKKPNNKNTNTNLKWIMTLTDLPHQRRHKSDK